MSGTLTFSLVDAFELQGSSGRIRSCTATVTTACVPFSDDRSGDLKYVGVSSEAPVYKSFGLDPFSFDPAGDGSLPPAMLDFGIATQGPWKSPAGYQEYDVLIDLDGSNGPDAVLFNTRIDGTDHFISRFEDSRGNILDEELIDTLPGFLDMDQINGDVMTMPVALAALKSAGYDPTTRPRISYYVNAFTEETGITDTIGDPFAGQRLLSVDPRRPALMASDTTSDDSACQGTGVAVCFPTLNDDQPGIKLAVSSRARSLAGDKPLGLLLLHHNNIDGNRAQVVKVATTTALALQKTKEAAGFRDPAKVTVRSGAGVPTGSVKVFNGRHRIGTFHLSGGVVRLRLPAMSRGRHVIRVVYLGDAFHASSRTHRTITVV